MVHIAVQNLVASGTTVIAAAGNDSLDVSQVVPAGWPELITVSAMADSDGLPGADGRQIRIKFQRYNDDSFASFSNYGSGIDVIAPGVKELLAKLGGGTKENTGTSFAAPYAAGVAAIFIRDRLDRSEQTPLPGTVRQALIETGECYNSGSSAGMQFHGTNGCPQTWPGDPDNAAEPLVRADNVANFGPPLPVHDLAVTGLDPGTPILAGETHSVLVTIINDGTEDETDFSASLSDDSGSTSAPQTVTLTAGAIMTLTFSWTPNSAGDHVLTAVVDTVTGELDTGDNSLSMTVTVQDPVHDVAVTGITAPTSVTLGDTVNVTVDISNTGTFDESFGVGLTTTSGTVNSNQSVTLIPGGTDSLTFTWDTTSGTLGGKTLTATAAPVTGETITADNSHSTTSTIVAPAAIELFATGYKLRGRHNVDLIWSGATSMNVDIWRDGLQLETTANDGNYTDAIGSRGGVSYTYRVCEAGGITTCSNSVTVTF